MKSTTTLTIDTELLTEAKKRGMNISNCAEEGLRMALKPVKQDFNSESLKVICAICFKEITSGYRCEYKKRAICEDCHASYNMRRCCDGDSEHIHLKFNIENGKQKL